MSHGLFEEKVALEPIKHVYTDKNGDEYVSVSKVLSLLSEPFENTFAYKNATPEKLAEWKEKGDVARKHGTDVHKAIETYAEFKTCAKPEWEEGIKSILEVYKGWRSYDEVCLYDEKYRIAGTADKISAVGTGKNVSVIISDFKTNVAKGIYYHSEYSKCLYPPFEHLQDANYIKYSLQLSLYAYMFEGLTGRKIKRMFIHFIPPDDFTKHEIIPVNYMKHDVKLLLDTYKPQIDLLLAQKQVSQENEAF